MTDPTTIPNHDWRGATPLGMPLRDSRGAGVAAAATPAGERPPITDPHRVPRLAKGDWAIDLSPPPLDAEGNPARMDALPVVWARLQALFGHGSLGPAIRRMYPGRNLLEKREIAVDLFAFRGPNGERAWEVGRG